MGRATTTRSPCSSTATGPRPLRTAAAGVIVLLLVAFPSAARTQQRAPSAAPEAEGEPRWLLPTAHAAGVLLVTRVGLSVLWPDSFDVTRVEENARTFRESWSEPPRLDAGGGWLGWDGDPWTINLVGHGLMGSELYLTYRQAGHGGHVAWVMTALWTLVWEYLVEAWHQRPSGLDLIVTTTAGPALGEARYQLYRRVAAMQPGAGRHLLFYLLDPLGQAERDLLGLARPLR